MLFEGARKDYVFKLHTSGLGYYLDVDREKYEGAAPLAAARGDPAGQVAAAGAATAGA